MQPSVLQTFSLLCPHCSKQFTVSAEKAARYRGHRVKCPACGNVIAVAADFGLVAVEAAPAVAAPPVIADSPAYAPAWQAPMRQAPPRSSGLNRWAIAAIVGGAAVVLVGVLLLILLPSISRARETARRVQCASNMRQISMAMLIYTSANGGAYPTSLSDLLASSPSLSPSVFVCPSSNDTPAPGGTRQEQADHLNDGGHLSYLYAGAGLTVRTAGANTPLLYEPASAHNGDGMNMLFGDGRIEFLTPAQAQGRLSTATLAPGHITPSPTPPVITPSGHIKPSPAPLVTTPPAFKGKPFVRPVPFAEATAKSITSPLYGDVIDLMGDSRLDPTDEATMTPFAGPAGRLPWCTPGPDPKDLIGIVVKLNQPTNKVAFHSLQPMYAGVKSTDPDICQAKSGYVVGGILADADDQHVHAIRIIFERQTDGHNDPKDQYLSDWIGTPVTNSPPKLLAGHGEHVVGLCGNTGNNIAGVGLIIAP